MASNGPSGSAMKPAPMKMPSAELNEDLGAFFGYLTLAILALIILLRAPSFIHYQLRTISRPASFRRNGYFLFKDNDKAPKNSTDINELKNQTEPRPSGNGSFGGQSPRIKLTLFKLYHIKVPFISTTLSDLTLGDLVCMLVYMIVLVILALYRNIDGDTSLMNYRRMGFIAIAQFPLLFILAIKNSPFAFLVGFGYEKLNFIHRFIGRMIFLFAIVHGALQMNMQMKLKGTIQFHRASRFGLIALCTLAVINLAGLRLFRSVFYQTFLIIHILGYITLIVVLWLHADCTQPFLAACIAFLAYDNLAKIVKSRVKRANFTAMPGGLTRIEVKGVNDGWRAGQHVFLRVLKGRNIFEKHPFTIANAPASSTPYGTNDHLLIVAKATGGFTKRIHQIAGEPRENTYDEKVKSSPLSGNSQADEAKAENSIQSASAVQPNFFSSDVSHYVLLDGPYGTSFSDMTRYHTVLLCAGGSGFTYCMAALEDIIGESARSGKSMTKHVCLVWSLREPGMIGSFGSAIEETIQVGQAHGIKVTVKMFLTKSNGQEAFDRSFLRAPWVEMNSIRPNFTGILEELTGKQASINGGGLGVGACGPTGFVDSVKQAVINLDADRVQSSGGVKLHTEKFGW